MKELAYHIAAVSFILNLWLLIYSIPKLRREVSYWRMRCTWHERYIDELIDNNRIIFDDNDKIDTKREG